MSMSLFFTKSNVKQIATWAILLNICVICKAVSGENIPRIKTTDLTPQKIYSIAQDRNGKALSTIREYLNIKDENGNTALCLAQQNKDKESFKMLLVFGASKDVECYDNTDPICAVIVGEKLKVRGAGWLLGAAATAGAIYGATELLDNKKCPSGYSVQYQTVADCGKTGAEGWIYDWNKKDEKGKLCGRCTPKTYNTGCTTLWQSVNDCGEHPEGWLFESSGFSGDEVCGICTPKQCVNRDSTSIRGENIRYTSIEYCPHRDYMRPSSQEQKGWSGVHGCYICNYVCDEKNGFAQEPNCEKNAEGHTAYNCAKDADTQCYYHTSPKACPVTNSPTTRGSNVSYDKPENCPLRRYMVANSVTPNSWSGEGQCYTCNYICDEEYGFANESTCKTNESGGEGYICQLDPNTRCYYRSATSNPEAPDGGQKECPVIKTSATIGASTFYTSKDACPYRKFMVADNVSPNGWSGEGQCYNCNYRCDDENGGYDTITACKTNESGGEGYICQLDPNTRCYYRSTGATPEAPDGGQKECPVVNTNATIGASTFYSSKDACPFRKFMVAESVTPNGWSGEGQCYNCNYRCNVENGGYDTLATCQTNESGGQGYNCQLDPNTRCYYRSTGATPEAPDGGEKECADNYSTAYQSQSNCAIIGGIPDGWKWSQNGWSGELKCGKCEANKCSGKGSTTYKTVADCPIVPNKIAVAVQAAGDYAGTEPCNECIYWCDPAQAAFNSESACKTNVTDLNCQLDAASGCWIAQDGCPEGYSTRVTECSPSDGYDHNCSGTSPNNGKSCCKCDARTCDIGSADIKNCSYETHPEGWRFEVVDHAGSAPCGECQARECNGGSISCSGGTYYDSVADTSTVISYAGNTPCYRCVITCNRNTMTYEECVNGISDAEIGSKYCSDPEGHGCYIYRNCTYSTIEDCPGYSEHPSHVTFTPGTKGGCGSCEFDCSGIEFGEDGYKFTGSPCSDADGWVGGSISGTGCYYCTAKACDGFVQNNPLTKSDCYQSQCSSVSCECTEAESTFTPATSTKSGGESCWLCAYNPQCPSGYQSDSDGADTDDYKCAGASKCYKTTATTPASMSLRADIANNQTLIVRHTEGDYLGNTNINAAATAPVTDELTGETTGGDAEGSITVYNSASNAEVTLQAGANRAVFNAKADGEGAENTISAKGSLKLIMEEGAENVTAAAISTNRNAYNAFAEGNSKASGIIDVEDTKAATNVIYGIMARRNAYNAVANGTLAQASGTININTATDKQAYGMYAGRDIYNQSTQNQTSIVNVKGSGAGDLYGLYSEQGSVYNSGNVNVHAAHGNAYGIYVANGEGQVVDNSGNIIVASDTKTAYGIYIENASEGMTLINSGLINATGDENSRGIKVAANGQNAVVTNTGRIIVNGAENAGNTAIDLGGGTLANAGEVEFIGAQNLDDLNGKITLEKGGKYKADSLSGNLKIGKSVVMEGFEDTYRQKDGIDAEDIEGLEVTSESAMFKGTAEKNSHNGYDAVATRRNFNEFTPNESIAEYLEENYKRQRLAEMFMQLKSNETDFDLSQDILSETGADFLINIPAENLAALRNAGEVIAESALTPTDEENRIMSGADSYIINANGRRGATGYDTTAATAFMYGDKRLNNKNRLGLGLSFMQMSTSYDNSVDRKENFVSLFIPWIHKFSDKLRLASVFTAGYGYGDYDRGNDREADIQDIIYGITNKLVYEINLADIAELEPALVLNAIGYYQDEMDDGTLTVKSGNHLSVEAGIGLYLKKELMDSKYGRLTARLGGMYYHEFADPYNKMRAGLNGGVGSFEINDFANIYSRDRAVLSAMLNYEYKKLALYLKYFHLLQRNKAQNFDMGIRYNF